MLPRLTHLQFIVIGALLDGAHSGKEVRAELKRARAHRSGPSFYQMMARMEDAGLVSGWYEQEIVEGQIIRERRYELTAAGRSAWQQSRDFYLAWIERYGGSHASA